MGESGVVLLLCFYKYHRVDSVTNNRQIPYLFINIKHINLDSNYNRLMWLDSYQCSMHL